MGTRSKNDKGTGKAGTGTGTGSTVRSGSRTGEHVVTVQFGAWGPQETHVTASSGGGRDGAPYVAVTVGALLTYAYTKAAVDSHLDAWTKAAEVNRFVRLPEFAPASGHRRHVGEDLVVACTVSAGQQHSVTSQAGADGRPVLIVTVGAVTVHVHTPTALHSYLAAWTRAATVTALLEDARGPK